jgi:hypothetical protein
VFVVITPYLRKGRSSAFVKSAGLRHPAPDFFVYNFLMRLMTLRMPPAQKAPVTDHAWKLEKLADLINGAG